MTRRSLIAVRRGVVYFSRLIRSRKTVPPACAAALTDWRFPFDFLVWGAGRAAGRKTNRQSPGQPWAEVVGRRRKKAGRRRKGALRHPNSSLWRLSGRPETENIGLAIVEEESTKNSCEFIRYLEPEIHWMTPYFVCVVDTDRAPKRAAAAYFSSEDNF
ncbi:Hypothetical predicted protein [Podarcis lilfordi]|uniref:Uncharacterized protein n=1 Tax=Podarcis lilfordi TaxID=74358 RepID=A0AA35P8X5_9SAUR|nr:Hypothetical predicted protein [Podarcis lilfordi]